MPHIDREELQERLVRLEARRAVLCEERDGLGADLAEQAARAVALRDKLDLLRAKGGDAAATCHEEFLLRHQDTANAPIPRPAWANVAPRPKVDIRKLNRWEMLLELKVCTKALKENMHRTWEAEADRWKTKQEEAQRVLDRIRHRLNSMPKRYFESVHDLKAKLVQVLNERQKVEKELQDLEKSSGDDVDALYAEIRDLRRQVSTVTDELEEAQDDHAYWNQQSELLAARCEPYRERYDRARNSFLAEFGGDAFFLAAMELFPSRDRKLPIDKFQMIIKEFVKPDWEELSDSELKQAAEHVGVGLDGTYDLDCVHFQALSRDLHAL